MIKEHDQKKMILSEYLTPTSLWELDLTSEQLDDLPNDIKQTYISLVELVNEIYIYKMVKAQQDFTIKKLHKRVEEVDSSPSKKMHYYSLNAQ